MNRNYLTRAIQVVLSTIGIGVAISFLLMTNLGTDPCSTINRGISGRTGISFGTCQLLINLLLLIIVVVWDKSLLGLGTICNMVLVGYSADFTTWILGNVFGTIQLTGMLQRIIVMIFALAFFVACAGVYMNCDMGTAPYDAFCFLIHKKLCQITDKKIKFRNVRMVYDASMSLIGFLLGGKVGIVTIGMILTLGPTVDLVGNIFKKMGKYK